MQCLQKQDKKVSDLVAKSDLFSFDGICFKSLKFAKFSIVLNKLPISDSLQCTYVLKEVATSSNAPITQVLYPNK